MTARRLKSSDDERADDALEEVRIELGDNVDGDEREPFIVTGNDVSSKESVAPAKPQKSGRNAAMAVAFYWVTSLSLVFLNKVVMVGDVTNLDAPLFMSWTQFVMTVIWYVTMYAHALHTPP